MSAGGLHPLGGIEAGGTKFVCAVGTSPADLVLASFDMSTPEEALEDVIGYFAASSIRSASLIDRWGGAGC